MDYCLTDTLPIFISLFTVALDASASFLDSRYLPIEAVLTLHYSPANILNPAIRYSSIS
jgi:hypothetical protein